MSVLNKAIQFNCLVSVMIFLLLGLVYVVIIGVAFTAPARVSLVLFVIDLFIPDPLPFVDEILLVIGMLKAAANDNI